MTSLFETLAVRALSGDRAALRQVWADARHLGWHEALAAVDAFARSHSELTALELVDAIAEQEATWEDTQRPRIS